MTERLREELLTSRLRKDLLRRQIQSTLTIQVSLKALLSREALQQDTHTRLMVVSLIHWMTSL